MLHPAWYHIVFTLLCFSLGVTWMTIFEEVCSTNIAKLRPYLMAGAPTLLLLSVFFPMMIESYVAIFSGLDWIIIITRIGAVAVSAFILGVGCVVCLRTYKDRSSLGKDQLFFSLFLYLLIVLASLMALATHTITLLHFYSTMPH